MAQNPSTVPADTGNNQGAATAQGVAGKPAASGATTTVAAAGSVPLFGGHRGGGKKRADGLPAGSPEALEVDRKKAAERMAATRAAKRAAALPAPLPSASALAAATPAVNPAGPLPPGGTAVPGVAPVVVVALVPWTQKLLDKPARLLTRILDRFRQMDIFKRLDKTNLPAPVKDEIKRDAEWKEDARNDFAASLAECAAIELNKRQVNAQNAHWINLAMSTGELAMAHFTLCDRIDRLVLEAQIAEQKAKERNSQTPRV